MTVEIKVPIPDQTTEKVRIVGWKKNVGDIVKKGDCLLEIETDKAVMEVESAGDGVVLTQQVSVDDMVPVGQVIGLIGAPGEKAEPVPQQAQKADIEAKTGTVSQKKEPAEKTKVSPLAKKIAEKTGINVSAVKGTGLSGKVMKKDVEFFAASARQDSRIFASPNARRLAKESGVDLSLLKGSGPEGRIIGKDIAAAAKNSRTAGYSQPVSGPRAGTEVELTRIRRAIGVNLQKSFRDTPHFNVTVSVDMTEALKFRADFNSGKEKNERISVNDLVMKAAAMTLRRHPAVNSKFMDDKIKYEANINIGIAAAVEAGLVVPVVLNADKLNFQQLAAETKSVIAQAKNGKLVGAGAGTFTISNLGMFGVDEFTAIINPPEAAILAVGAVRDRVVPVDGMIAIRPILKITLCSDHRVIDGAVAAGFLQSLRLYLEEDIAAD